MTMRLTPAERALDLDWSVLNIALLAVKSSPASRCCCFDSEPSEGGFVPFTRDQRRLVRVFYEASAPQGICWEAELRLVWGVRRTPRLEVRSWAPGCADVHRSPCRLNGLGCSAVGG